MVANRALNPKSKLAVETWVERDVVLPGLENVEVQQLYRAMDELITSGDALQEEVFSSVAHLGYRRTATVFSDGSPTSAVVTRPLRKSAGNPRPA